MRNGYRINQVNHELGLDLAFLCANLTGLSASALNVYH
jgi:hypothetical protein